MEKQVASALLGLAGLSISPRLLHVWGARVAMPLVTGNKGPSIVGVVCFFSCLAKISG